jgi:quinol monooxygenase YgiN
MLIIYKVRIKQNLADAFQKLADKTLIPEAHTSSGCQLFSLYQNMSDKHEFIFHEIWDSEANVNAYKQKLIAMLGEPHAGEEFPAIMNDMIEADEDLVQVE